MLGRFRNLEAHEKTNRHQNQAWKDWTRDARVADGENAGCPISTQPPSITSGMRLPSPIANQAIDRMGVRMVTGTLTLSRAGK